MKSLFVSGYALLVWGMIPLVLSSTFTSCGKLEELLNGGEEEEEDYNYPNSYYEVMTNDGAAPYFELETTSITLPAVRSEEGMQVKYQTNISNVYYILEKYKKYDEGEQTQDVPSFILEYPEGYFYDDNTIFYFANYTHEKQADNLLIYASDNDSLLATIPIEQEVGPFVNIAKAESTFNSITLTLEGQNDVACYTAVINEDSTKLNQQISDGIRYGYPISYDIYNLQGQPTITFSNLTEATKYYIYLQAGTDQNSMCGVTQYTVTTSMRSQEDALILEYQLNALNNNTVYLPFAGEVKGVIDWGDGTTEPLEGSYSPATLYHKYGEGTSSTVSVTFKGSVEALLTNSDTAQGEVLKASLLGITQWGDPELKNINLQGAIALNYLATDTKGALANVTDFSNCFYGCTSLTSLPEGLFAKATNATNFEQTFYGCTSLNTLPSDLFANNAEATSFNGTFSGCTSLETLPATLFTGATKAETFNRLFYECSSLTTLPEGLFDQTANVSDISQAFSHCSKLKQIPVNLFDHMRRLQSTSELFYECTLLTGESPYTVINGSKVHLYERQNYSDEFLKITYHSNTYLNCTGLSDYGSIPDEWK